MLGSAKPVNAAPTCAPPTYSSTAVGSWTTGRPISRAGERTPTLDLTCHTIRRRARRPFPDSPEAFRVTYGP